jgi:hypothetical protein
MSRVNFTSKFVPHDMERLLMKLAAVSTRLLNGLAFFLLLAMLAFSGAGLAEERAQPSAPEAAPSVVVIKAAIDEAESVIDDATVTAEKLRELRQKIGDLASTLGEKSSARLNPGQGGRGQACARDLRPPRTVRPRVTM